MLTKSSCGAEGGPKKSSVSWKGTRRECQVASWNILKLLPKTWTRLAETNRKNGATGTIQNGSATLGKEEDP